MKTAEPILAPSYKRPTVQGVRAALLAANVPLRVADSWSYDNKAQVSKKSYGDEPLSALVEWWSGPHRTGESRLLGKTYIEKPIVLLELRRILLAAGFRAVIQGFKRYAQSDRMEYELIVLSSESELTAPDVSDAEIQAQCRESTLQRLREKLAENQTAMDKTLAPFLKVKTELEAQLLAM